MLGESHLKLVVLNIGGTTLANQLLEDLEQSVMAFTETKIFYTKSLGFSDSLLQ